MTLTAAHIDAARSVADVLIPRTAERPALREADPDARWLTVAFAARDDRADDVRALLDQLPEVGDPKPWLRRLRSDHRDVFDALASVIAGAYYMTPTVRDLIGYPGQERRPAPVTLAADELSDEIFEGAMNYDRSFRKPHDFAE